MTNNIILNSLNNQDMVLAKNEILKTNEESALYGLTLTPKDIDEVIKSRAHSLKSYGRIDLNMDITKKLIKKLYTSQYTDKDDYVELINDIQDIFYYLKNETFDEISDDEVIDIIGDFYEKCSGRIDNVQNLSETFGEDYRCKRVGINE